MRSSSVCKWLCQERKKWIGKPMVMAVHLSGLCSSSPLSHTVLMVQSALFSDIKDETHFLTLQRRPDETEAEEEHVPFLSERGNDVVEG